MPITPRYSTSAKNIIEIRDMYGNASNKIKIGAVASNVSSINCRGIDIVIPDNMTVASFVKNGFSDELKLGGAYSENSETELTARILNLDVECNIGTGHWITEMEITVGKSKPFIIKNVYDFEGAYIGDTAYHNAQFSLNSALQDFYGLIIKHPELKSAFNH